MLIKQSVHKFTAKCLSAIILLLGLLVIFGWYAHVLFFIQPYPGFAPMRFNSALCFAFAGAGLLAYCFNRKLITLCCGLLIGLTGSLTLIEYLALIDFNFDDLFINYQTIFKGYTSGRMAFLTANGFMLVALILIRKGLAKTNTNPFYNRLMAALLLIMGSAHILSYLNGMNTDNTLGLLTPMAPHTAMGFILFSVATYVNTWGANFKKEERPIAWLSIIATAILFILTVSFWLQSLKEEEALQIGEVYEEGQTIRKNINNQLDASFFALRRMAQRWEVRQGTPKKEWMHDVDNYLSDTQGLITIEWIDSSGQSQWIRTQTRTKPKNSSYSLAMQRDFKLVLNQAPQVKPSVSPPIKLYDKHHGFIIDIPLYYDQQFQGIITGVYDATIFIENALPVLTKELFDIEIIEGGSSVYQSPTNYNNKLVPTVISFDFLDMKWKILVRPRLTFLAKTQLAVPDYEFVRGGLLALLAGIALYNLLIAIQRDKKLISQSAELSKIERRQQQIVERIEDYAIFWIDLQGNIESWNIGAERIFGYTMNDILGKSCTIFFTEVDQNNALPQQILKTVSQSNKFEKNGWLRRKNGTNIWANLVVETVKNAEEEQIGYAVFVQNKDNMRELELERNRLLNSIDESPDFIGMADSEGHLLYHNKAAKMMVGLPWDYDMSKRNISDMHPDWANKKMAQIAFPTVFSKGSWRGENVLLHHQTGKEIPVLQTLTLHRDEARNPLYLTTYMHDITERKKMEEALAASEETFRATIECAATGMALVSLDGHLIKVNKALCHIVGYSEVELLALSFQEITHPDDLQIDLNYINQLLAGAIETYEMEKRYVHKNGMQVWVLLNVSLIRDSDGKPLYFISQIQSIDKQKKIEQELKYIAYHDTLTHLHNRKQLEPAFDLALAYAKRDNTGIALMFLDIDHFKDINDKYGHDVGDALLIKISQRLRQHMRTNDILVRLGGDEFIIVITELLDQNLSLGVAKKITETIRAPMLIKGHSFEITMSIGISLYPKDGSKLNELIKKADKALYEVKEEGRNNFKLFNG